jgi:hypothetical protein
VGRASIATKTNFESIDNVKVVGGSLAAITTSGKEFFDRAALVAPAAIMVRARRY